MPKGPIVGNQLCWFGNFVYVTKDLTDPTQKLVQPVSYTHLRAHET